MFLLILIRSSQLRMAQPTGENAGGAADQVAQGGLFTAVSEPNLCQYVYV